MVHFSAALLNRFVGHRVTKFKHCDAPDLTTEFPESSHWMANRIKHAGEDLASGQYEDGATLPVWCLDDGLHCRNAMASYQEIASVLREIGTVANRLQNARTAAQQS